MRVAMPGSGERRTRQEKKENGAGGVLTHAAVEDAGQEKNTADAT
jgi:hypothetical protein